MRTPKIESHDRLSAALLAARTETSILVLLWGSGIAIGIVAHPTVLLLSLLAWQGVVYGAAPFMSWLAQRTKLSPESERRRRTERARERLVSVLRPVAIGSMAATCAVGCAFIVVIALARATPVTRSTPLPFLSAPERRVRGEFRCLKHRDVDHDDDVHDDNNLHDVDNLHDLHDVDVDDDNDRAIKWVNHDVFDHHHHTDQHYHCPNNYYNGGGLIGHGKEQDNIGRLERCTACPVGRAVSATTIGVRPRVGVSR